MSFALYLTANAAGRCHYTFVRHVQMAGSQRGLLGIFLSELEETHDKNPRWHLSEEDLLARLGFNGGKHALVIDLMPDKKDKGQTVKRRDVSLYRIRSIWGFTYPEYVPVVLLLECLCLEVPPSIFYETNSKEAFEFPISRGTMVCDFLYLNGKARETRPYCWGMVGFVNGALLWKDAFDFFHMSIANELTIRGKVGKLS